MTNSKKSLAEAQETLIFMATQDSPKKQPNPKNSDPNQLSSLIEALGLARTASARSYEMYKARKEEEDMIRAELFVTLRAIGLKSLKGKDFTATVAEKPTIVITHEQSVIDWLKETPDIESDVYIGIKPTQFQALAKNILKTTGEVIPGTELQVQESLSIRSNK